MSNNEAEHLILLERQAKRIKELGNAIQIHCKKCWAIFRGSDPAQCRTCSLYRYKQTDPPMVWEP